MRHTKPTVAAGTLTLTIYSAKRWERTQVELRSDAAAWLGGHVLLVSAAGPESSCKALAAALHGDRRMECAFQWENGGAYGPARQYNLSQHQDGYRCYRTRLLPQYGLWQLVAVAKTGDFLSVLSEEALWQHLRGARYTTPLLREWTPWLQDRLTKENLLVKADGYGCQAGFCHATSEDLDQLVEQGLRDGTLHLGRQAGRGRHSALAELPDLDAYVQRYGELLGRQTEKTLAPLHVPSEHPAVLPPLLRDPFPAQAHVITSVVKALKRQDAVLIAAQIGTGKAQPLDAKVLTPHGWKLMGELKVGDLVTDPTGGTAKIRAVYPQGVKPVFKVTFSDGASTECCNEHLWYVTTPMQKWLGQPGRVMDLMCIQEDYLSKNVATHGKRMRKYFVPLTVPVEFDQGEIPQLPLDPYLLGCLLGDGSMIVGSPTITSADQEIIESVRDRLPRGLSLTELEDTYSYRISTGQKGGSNQLTTWLRILGLWGCRCEKKFVPAQYMRATSQDRLSLLQGLLDTDGNVSSTSTVEFSSTSQTLAENVQELIRSFGGTATIRQRQTHCTYLGTLRAGLPSWRVFGTLPPHVAPFALERKRSRYLPGKKYGPARGIADISPAGEKECACISLDSPSQLYITNDYIVTHNSLLSAVAVHSHAAGRPYRALVFAPGHLVGSEDQVGKWRREIEETVPGAIVRTIDRWTDLLPLRRTDPLLGAEWWIIGRDRAKLGYCWRPACQQTRAGLKCPRCGGVLTGPKGRLTLAELKRTRQTCKSVLVVDGYSRQEVGDKVLAVPVWVPAVGCGEQLWQATREINRFAPADYIKQHLKTYWTYLVLDEVHQEKSSESAQANAAGALISATKKTIALSGSICGGFAWHLKHLLFRMAPRSLVEDGITWDGDTAFNERYGRIETVVREKASGGLSPDNRQSRGKVSRSVQKNVRPGIMPALFGRHLLDKSVFLSLDEVAEGLPTLSEECCPVPLDEDQLAEYVRIEAALKEQLKVMLPRGDRRLLSTMLQTLLAYPDYPYGWEDVGYWEGKTDADPGIFVPVVRPYNLDKAVVRPKERQLVELCLGEKRAGRQVWVYVQFTQRHDVQGRLEGLLKAAGLRVMVMRSAVPVDAREEWIAKHGPRQDVIISHPKLVETGLDLFDKGGRHNFATLCFYETGYDTFTLRQASGRSWRLLQPLPCRVVYLYYAATMQDRAMALMGRKLAASEALEGKFSTEGLIALGGEDAGSVEMQLARSLCGKLDLGDGRRSWERVGARTLGVFQGTEDQPAAPHYKRLIDERPAQLELFA